MDQRNAKHVQTLLAKDLKAVIDANHIIEIVPQGGGHLGVATGKIPTNMQVFIAQHTLEILPHFKKNRDYTE